MLRSLHSLPNLMLALVLLVAATAAHAVSLAPGDIVVTDQGKESIFKVDPATGVATLISANGNLQDPRGIVIDTDGTLLVADKAAGAILRVDPADGSQTVVSSGGSFNDPTGIALEASGDILVADPGAGEIFRVDPATGSQSSVASGFNDPFGIDLAVDGSGGILFTDEGDEALLRVDPLTGTTSVISQNGDFKNPRGVAIDASGDVFVAEKNEKVIRVDGATGAQTVVSQNGDLKDPTGIAIDADGNLLIADPAADAILSVDPVSGAQSVVSASSSFGNPFGLAVVPEPSLALLVVFGLLGLALTGRRRRADEGTGTRAVARGSVLALSTILFVGLGAGAASALTITYDIGGGSQMVMENQVCDPCTVGVTGTLTLEDDEAGNVLLTAMSLSHGDLEVAQPPFFSVILNRSDIGLGAGDVLGFGSTLGSTVDFGTTTLAQTGTLTCTGSFVQSCSDQGLQEGSQPLTPTLPGIDLGVWDFDASRNLMAAFVFTDDPQATETLELQGTVASVVPEPATILLLASAAASLGARRLRRGGEAGRRR